VPQEFSHAFPRQDSMLLKLKIVLELLKIRVGRLAPKDIDMHVLLLSHLESFQEQHCPCRASARRSGADHGTDSHGAGS
jgi:hypothetical protein